MLLHRLTLDDQTGFQFGHMEHANYNGLAPEHALAGMVQAYRDRDVVSKTTTFIENRWGYGDKLTKVVVMGRNATLANIGKRMRIRVTKEPFLIMAGTPAWLKVSAPRAVYEPVLLDPLFIVRADVDNLSTRINQFFHNTKVTS